MAELPRGWVEASVIDAGRLKDARRIPLNNSERAERQGPYPYYGANGLVDHIDGYLFEGEHVLLAEDGGNFLEPTKGVAYIVDGKFWVNNHAHIIEPVAGMSASFIRHWLNALPWNDYVGGSTRLKLTQSGMKKAPFPLPPLAEQERIVAKVDSLLARIARAREELGRVPVLVERCKALVLGQTAPSQVTEAEGKTTNRWKKRRIADVCNATFDGPFGSNLKSSDYVASGVRVVRLENIGSLEFIRDKETYVSLKKFEALKRHKLVAGDVLFSSFIMERIRVCIYPDDLPTNSINKADCFCLRPSPTVCLPQFLAFRLAAPVTYEILSEGIHGATRPRISLSHLKAFTVDLPPVAEQAEIVRRIESAFARLDRATADHALASKLLDNLEQQILAKAFRGELVPQDPDDEPASALLARINGEKEQAASAPPPKRSPISAAKPKTPRQPRTQAMPKARTDDDVWHKPYLAGMLTFETLADDIDLSAELGIENAGPRAPEVVAQAIFKKSELEIADFYKQLAWEIENGHIVETVGRLKAA
jgi:type I restriction enzyme, S subunit